MVLQAFIFWGITKWRRTKTQFTQLKVSFTKWKRIRLNPVYLFIEIICKVMMKKTEPCQLASGNTSPNEEEQVRTINLYSCDIFCQMRKKKFKPNLPICRDPLMHQKKTFWTQFSWLLKYFGKWGGKSWSSVFLLEKILWQMWSKHFDPSLPAGRNSLPDKDENV